MIERIRLCGVCTNDNIPHLEPLVRKVTPEETDKQISVNEEEE